MSVQDKPLVIAGVTFESRLIVGTGKYPSHEVMKRCHEASGAEDGGRRDAGEHGALLDARWSDRRRGRALAAGPERRRSEPTQGV